jgi:predicted nucleic acid-binding Zn ribbon protein
LSSWKDKIQKKYGPHHHCIICGRAIPEGKKYCSQDCKDSATAYERKQKKKSRIQIYFFIGMIIFMFIMIFITGGLGA